MSANPRGGPPRPQNPSSHGARLPLPRGMPPHPHGGPPAGFPNTIRPPGGRAPPGLRPPHQANFEPKKGQGAVKREPREEASSDNVVASSRETKHATTAGGRGGSVSGRGRSSTGGAVNHAQMLVPHPDSLDDGDVGQFSPLDDGTTDPVKDEGAAALAVAATPATSSSSVAVTTTTTVPAESTKIAEQRRVAAMRRKAAAARTQAEDAFEIDTQSDVASLFAPPMKKERCEETDNVEKAFGQYSEECASLADLPAPSPAVRRSPFESRVKESPTGSDHSGMYPSPRPTTSRPDEATESDAEGKRKRISLNDYKQRKSEPHESHDPRFNPGYGYPYSQCPSDSNRPAGLVAKDYSYERVGRRQITSREGKPAGDDARRSKTRAEGQNIEGSVEGRNDRSLIEDDAKTVLYDDRRGGRDSSLNVQNPRADDQRSRDGRQSSHERLTPEARTYPGGHHGSVTTTQTQGRGDQDRRSHSDGRPDERSQESRLLANGLPEVSRSKDERRHPEVPNQRAGHQSERYHHDRRTNFDNQALPPGKTNPDHRSNAGGRHVKNDLPPPDSRERAEEKRHHDQQTQRDHHLKMEGQPHSHDRLSQEEQKNKHDEQRRYDDGRTQIPSKRRMQNDTPEGHDHPAKRPYPPKDRSHQQQQERSQHQHPQHAQQLPLHDNPQHRLQHPQHDNPQLRQQHPQHDNPQLRQQHPQYDNPQYRLQHPKQQQQEQQKRSSKSPAGRCDPHFAPESRRERRGKRSLDRSVTSDSQTEGSEAERSDAYKHIRESRQRTSQGMRYLRRNLETMKKPRDVKGEKRIFQHWKTASKADSTPVPREDGCRRFTQLRKNQRQSYHDEGHAELPTIKQEREGSPDLEEQLFAPLTTQTPAWTRSSPADVYYQRDMSNPRVMNATPRITVLSDKFEHDILSRGDRALNGETKYEPPSRKVALQHVHRHSCCGKKKQKDENESHDHDHKHGKDGNKQKGPNDDDESSSSSSEEEEVDVTFDWMDELERKKLHPRRVHPELWFNEPAQLNDGPICRCSLRARKAGIRHLVFPGESEVRVPKCDLTTNNGDKLFHYRIIILPHTNFLLKNPTVIDHDGHDYIFEGFSIFTHHPVADIPDCRVIRFNIEYSLVLQEEKLPDNFSVRELELFKHFIYEEVLELMDLDWALKTTYKLFDEFGAETSDDDLDKKNQSCSLFHLMPRFARDLPDNGKELLSMNQVLLYLMKSSKPLISDKDVESIPSMSDADWKSFVGEVRGTIVTRPGKMPSSVRVDQVDREVDKSKQTQNDRPVYPEFVHFGIRPAQLSYAGDPKYQKAWKQYVKLKHLLYNKPKITDIDREKLEAKLEQLQDIRTKSSMKREVTVAMSSQGWYRTGIRSDVTQHALIIPVLTSHIRFHRCLKELETIIGYSFKDRRLLQLALTHPSYRVNYGTNPDHARNTLSNCGIRQPNYGDRSIHFVNSRKRGINTLIYIMSKMGQKQEKLSDIMHNERLEYLGDAVVEFLTSIHLFFMFPDLEEGGLSTYRAAIVQNQHLAVLAKKLRLQDFMLYAHGPDLCHDSDLKHAMANCYEALMGAVYLDSGIQQADKILAGCLFPEEDMYNIWMNLPRHPLQEQEPEGDRHWIQQVKALEKLTEFEEAVSVQFTHIRLLARAFTLRSVGYNNLCLGHNQRMEFLGDTILQLIASDYLYRHFPEHHEGHLSLLRSSLVNNRTQAQVFDDLGMEQYVIHANDRKGKFDMKSKERADVLEALLGALYVDKDLEYCKVLCNVCFFPRLESFILNQEWNDPKSQLQQCCLTLRSLEEGEPDIPVYKVVESKGPTNTRSYTVAVYFRGVRLAKGQGHSIQQAEMDAASNALAECRSLFPQLEHQKRVIEKKYHFYRNKGQGLCSVGPVGAKIQPDKKDEEWHRTKEKKIQQILAKLDRRNKDQDRAAGFVDNGPGNQKDELAMPKKRLPPKQYRTENEEEDANKPSTSGVQHQRPERQSQPVGDKRNWARDKQAKSRYLEESSAAASKSTTDVSGDTERPSLPQSSSKTNLNGHPDDEPQNERHRENSLSRNADSQDVNRPSERSSVPASRSRESLDSHHSHSSAHPIRAESSRSSHQYAADSQSYHRAEPPRDANHPQYPPHSRHDPHDPAHPPSRSSSSARLHDDSGYDERDIRYQRLPRAFDGQHRRFDEPSHSHSETLPHPRNHGSDHQVSYESTRGRDREAEGHQRREAIGAHFENREAEGTQYKRREADRGHSERREVDGGHSERREADGGHTERRQAERGHFERQEADGGHYMRRNADGGPSEWRQADRGHTERREAERGSSEHREAEGHENRKPEKGHYERRETEGGYHKRPVIEGGHLGRREADGFHHERREGDVNHHPRRKPDGGYYESREGDAGHYERRDIDVAHCERRSRCEERYERERASVPCSQLNVSDHHLRNDSNSQDRGEIDRPKENDPVHREKLSQQLQRGESPRQQQLHQQQHPESQQLRPVAEVGQECVPEDISDDELDTGSPMASDDNTGIQQSNQKEPLAVKSGVGEMIKVSPVPTEVVQLPDSGSANLPFEIATSTGIHVSNPEKTEVDKNKGDDAQLLETQSNMLATVPLQTKEPTNKLSLHITNDDVKPPETSILSESQQPANHTDPQMPLICPEPLCLPRHAEPLHSSNISEHVPPSNSCESLHVSDSFKPLQPPMQAEVQLLPKSLESEPPLKLPNHQLLSKHLEYEQPSMLAEPQQPLKLAEPHHPLTPLEPLHLTLPETQQPSKLPEPQQLIGPKPPSRPLEPQQPLKLLEPQRPLKLLEPYRLSEALETQKPSKLTETQSLSKSLETQPPSNLTESEQPFRPLDPQQPLSLHEPQLPIELSEHHQPSKLPEPQKPSRLSQPQHLSKCAEHQQPLKLVGPQQPSKVSEPQQPLKQLEWRGSISREGCRGSTSAEAQHPLKSAESQQPLKSTESQQPCKSTESQPPLKSTELQQPLKSLESQQPSKSVESQQPLKSTESPQPLKSTELQQPLKSGELQQTLKSAEPQQVLKSAEPQQPSRPLGPQNPSMLEGPEEGECEEGEITDDDDDETNVNPPSGTSTTIVGPAITVKSEPASTSYLAPSVLVNKPPRVPSVEDGILGAPPPGLKPIMPKSSRATSRPPLPIPAQRRLPPGVMSPKVILPPDAQREREEWAKRMEERKKEVDAALAAGLEPPPPIPLDPAPLPQLGQLIEAVEHGPREQDREMRLREKEERHARVSRQEIKREPVDFYDPNYHYDERHRPPPRPSTSGSSLTESRNPRRLCSPQGERRAAYERRETMGYDHHRPEYQERPRDRSREPGYVERERKPDLEVGAPRQRGPYQERDASNPDRRGRDTFFASRRDPGYNPPVNRDYSPSHSRGPPGNQGVSPTPPHSGRPPGNRDFSPPPLDSRGPPGDRDYSPPPPYLRDPPGNRDYSPPPPHVRGPPINRDYSPPPPHARVPIRNRHYSPPPPHARGPHRDFSPPPTHYAKDVDYPPSSRPSSPPGRERVIDYKHADLPPVAPRSREFTPPPRSSDYPPNRRDAPPSYEDRPRVDIESEYDRGRRPGSGPGSQLLYADRPTQRDESRPRSRIPLKEEYEMKDVQAGRPDDHYRRPAPPRGISPMAPNPSYGRPGYSRSPYGDRPHPREEPALVATAENPSAFSEKQPVENLSDGDDDKFNFVREALRD